MPPRPKGQQPHRISTARLARYHEFRKTLNRAESARRAGISYKTAQRIDSGEREQSDFETIQAKKKYPDYNPHVDRVLPVDELTPDARRALEDFELFRLRYFGHVSTPWQIEAAYQIKGLLESPHREYVVINCPPGAGKSTLFSHDINAWLTARNRALRGLIGSRTQRQARNFLIRLRRSLERDQPVQAKPQDLDAGAAHDAVATLPGDFGRFRPPSSERWNNDEIVVCQPNDIDPVDKEPTWSAYGMDGGTLGLRLDYVVWDDLVDRKNIRTAETFEELTVWWDDVAEARLEPSGLLCLVGQRLSSTDLYRYCLDKVEGDAFTEIDDEAAYDTAIRSGDLPRKYHHIRYPAHFDDTCTNDHAKGAKPWPDGCLLDPHRLPWRFLRSIEVNRADKYRIVYQQEDVDPSSVLVPMDWVRGGRGGDGVEYPGCWDETRRLWELPKGLTGDVFVVATADPSPTRMWSVQCWAYHPDSEQRFLLALERRAMTADEFLDWDHDKRVFVGLMEDWQAHSRSLGLPIEYWIVEQNAAQRFLLQYDHVKRWQQKWGVSIVPHNTGANKADPDYGVDTIRQHWRWGRVRLPGFPYDGSRLASLKLVDEVTRYPDATTDDCVMAEWFFEWQLPRIFNPNRDNTPVLWTPSWWSAA